MGRKRRRSNELPAKKRKLWTVICLLLVWGIAITARVSIDVYFPLDHQDLIKKYCDEFSLDEHGLDKYHVAAVICTESRFKDKAESGKGAVGLMQILPETGAWAAKKIGIDDYTDKSLWKPDVNIRIGCWYLAYLSDMFDDDQQKVFAAYNAGPANVKDWIQNGKLVNIEHTETKNYVVKIEKYYEIYKSLYNGF